METFDFPIKKTEKYLSLGAESMGKFAFYDNGKIFISPDFGDILDESNFNSYRKAVLRYIKSDKPDKILTDLHPLYRSTILGEELSKKHKVPYIKVQHHLAHIFSAIGDRFLQTTSYLPTGQAGQLPASFAGIAMDGTGYGLDGNIWGGEVFQIENNKQKDQKRSLHIKRIGSLEEQTMIGGDLAVREPARMLIAILAKLKTKSEKRGEKMQYLIDSKKDIYRYVKKYYSENEFALLFNQLQQDFNCQKTTSTGRVLDAASVLLGLADNKRSFKHEATKLLEENSTKPYDDYELRFTNYGLRKMLDTTHLFDYLLKNMHKDKKRLAATAQLYIASGLYEIVKQNIQYPCLAGRQAISNIHPVFLAGGMARNRIISAFLKSKGGYLSKTIPCGDEGIAFGQIIYHLFAKYI